MNKIKQQLAEAVSSVLGVMVNADQLTDPPSIEQGEFALPCFPFAKEAKKSPAVIAQEFAAALEKTGGVWETAVAAGPYVNFILKKEWWNKAVISDVPEVVEKKQKVMIEYSNPNTHKEFHIGHLRNVCLGASLVRLYRAAGYTVIAANYINDVGAHVARCLWNLEKNHAADVLPENKGKYLGDVYAESTRLMTEDQSVQAEVAAVLEKLQAKEPSIEKLWRETRQWSLDQFTQIYAEFDAPFDVLYLSSEEEEKADVMLRRLAKSGTVPEIRESQGALIADLEKYNLSVLVLIKSDGSKAYGAFDIPLTYRKFSEYELDQSLWIVDVRQSLYFQQIFKIMNLLGFTQPMIHVPYDIVTLPEGAMSSRKGNVIAYEDFRDTLVARLTEETQKRHPEWAPERVQQVAFTVALAAIKFGMLKYENRSVVIFDMATALSTEGSTGPYILYTLARLHSILRKASALPDDSVDYALLKEPEESLVIKEMSRLDDVLVRCVEQQQPSLLCTYAISLAQALNSWYHKHEVLTAAPDVQKARLALIQAGIRTLERALGLLNITGVEEM